MVGVNIQKDIVLVAKSAQRQKNYSVRIAVSCLLKRGSPKNIVDVLPVLLENMAAARLSSCTEQAIAVGAVQYRTGGHPLR